MRTVLRVVSVFALFCFSASAGQEQKPAATTPATGAEFKMPPEAAKAPNPVKPTPTSLAAGKKTYGYDCAMCHGKDGDGKGDLAGDMKLKMLDYTDPAALKDMTDGELFYIIKNGKGDMPAEGDRAKSDEVWNLVNYVRTLAKKDTSAKPKT
jgi:mono/diheme cytochrome c family protein